MSFDINPPNRNLSNVQASAKSCSGGAGNTGYFRRDDEEDNTDKLEFSNKDSKQDTFEKSNSGDNADQESFISLLINFFFDLIDNIKKFFTK